VVEATKKHGKHAGFGGPAFNDVELWTEIVQMGYRFVSCGSDLGFITAAARQRSAFLRGLQP
jgi:2-keto-3-deoxy-L-rhamnonate aldolase RhmA